MTTLSSCPSHPQLHAELEWQDHNRARGFDSAQVMVTPLQPHNTFWTASNRNLAWSTAGRLKAHTCAAIQVGVQRELHRTPIVPSAKSQSSVMYSTSSGELRRSMTKS